MRVHPSQRSSPERQCLCLDASKQVETDVAHAVASMMSCWDASLSIDRDTMVRVHIQSSKCFQEENKTEEIGQGQTSQTLKPGRAAGRINLLLAQRGHFKNGKEILFSFGGPHGGQTWIAAHPGPGSRILRLSAHFTIPPI